MGIIIVGNVLTLTTQITQPTASTEVVAFNYDALDRLTNAIAVTNGYTGTYGYDPIGNLITKTESAAPIVYTYGVTQPHAVRALSNGNSYTYDLNGNLTRRVEITATTNTYTQTWDVENRLTTVTGTMVYSCRNCPAPITSISQFTYDGDGNRVLKVEISGTQIITTAYAGAMEVQITGTQRITKTYYSAGSQLIALRQYTAPTSSVLYFLHGDHLGSVSVTTCGNSSGCGGVPNGGVLARQKYDAWGNVRSGSGAMPTDVGFTAQRSDATGLMYYRARYYAPSLGRFLSADTIVPEPGNPQALNRYTYVRNRPLNYIDPSGHRETRCDYEGCSATQNDLDQAIGNARRAEKIKFYRDCAQGGGTGCPNVGEIAASVAAGFVAMGLLSAAPEAIGFILDKLAPAAGAASTAAAAACADGDCTNEIKAIAELSNKLDYLLGKATGNLHNIQRSLDMLRQMQRIGLPDNLATREYLVEHFTRVVNDSTNILKIQENGYVVRESLLMGPYGGLKVQSTWDGAKLITVMLFGGGH